MAQKAHSSEMCRVATGIYEEIGEVSSLGKRDTGGAIAGRVLSDSRQRLSSLHLEETVSVAFRWPYFKPSVKMIRAKYDALLKGESAQWQGRSQ